jgi:hypothetical protein
VSYTNNFPHVLDLPALADLEARVTL